MGLLEKGLKMLKPFPSGRKIFTSKTQRKEVLPMKEKPLMYVRKIITPKMARKHRNTTKKDKSTILDSLKKMKKNNIYGSPPNLWKFSRS